VTFVLAGEPPVRGGNGRTICGPAESPEGDLLPSQRRCMPVGPNDFRRARRVLGRRCRCCLREETLGNKRGDTAASEEAER